MTVGKKIKTEETEYWENVKRGETYHDSHVWRRYCDQINTDLLSRWLSKDRQIEKLLKTDLHEETVGTGLCRRLCKTTDFLTGIDIGASPVQAATFYNPDLNGICADVRHLPFKDETFDLVVSTSTLDHFRTEKEILAGLKEIVRVLRSNGEVLLTLDNPLNPLVWIRNALPFGPLNRLGIVPYFVGRTLSPSEINQYLSEMKMKVEQTRVVMHIPRVLAVILSRWAEKRIGSEGQKKFLNFLLSFERISSWPTRYRTGYFIAVKAVKL